MVGFAVNSLSRYERDTRPIPMDIALRLEDFYEVDVKIFIP
ncbi:helix-turn-helix domain-containing protein [Sutcliffiella horikoshii]